MTSIDERLLETKMTQIEQARTWSPRVISKFETLIRRGDEVSLYRANPRSFARDRGMLLKRQTFRKLFRSERVDQEEGLGVRQVTFLFTAPTRGVEGDARVYCVIDRS